MDPEDGDADLWIKNLGRVASFDVERNIGGS